MPSPLKHAVKAALYRLLPKSDGYSDLRVLAGPARGSTLRLDVRVEGSYWIGRYDKWIFDRISIESWLPRDGVAWDCGSYVGYYAAIFRHIVGEKGQVHAFEASRTNYARVSQVPTMNGWENVHVHYLAIGPAHTRLQFVNNGGGMAGPCGMAKTFPNFGELDISTVDCCGVDELVFERGLPAPDFIKFDLESAEEYALLNGQRVFTEKRPALLLEIHGDGARAVTGEFLAEYGYTAHILGETARVARGPADMAQLTSEWHTAFCRPRPV